MALSIRITKAPSFFKVLMKDDFSTHLKIPDAFVNSFGELCTPKRILLKTGSDQFWKVDVAKVNESLYFQKGWERFVKDNLLDYKDFVVFDHVKNSTFKVKMYGPHGCEKRIQVVREHTNGETSAHSKEKRKRVADMEDAIHMMKRQKSRSQKHKVSREGFKGSTDKKVKTESIDNNFIDIDYPSDDEVDIDPPSEDEVDECKAPVKKRRSKGGIEERNSASAMALEEAKRFKSRNPFFHVVLQQSYVNTAMYLPSMFYRTHMKDKDKSASLEVSGRQWTVGLTVRGPGNSNYVKMIVGWKVFSKDNNLKAGDVCVFEMIKMDNVVFKVHIFRC